MPRTWLASGASRDRWKPKPSGSEWAAELNSGTSGDGVGGLGRPQSRFCSASSRHRSDSLPARPHQGWGQLLHRGCMGLRHGATPWDSVPHRRRRLSRRARSEVRQGLVRRLLLWSSLRQRVSQAKGYRLPQRKMSHGGPKWRHGPYTPVACLHAYRSVVRHGRMYGRCARLAVCDRSGPVSRGACNEPDRSPWPIIRAKHGPQ